MSPRPNTASQQPHPKPRSPARPATSISDNDSAFSTLSKLASFRKNYHLKKGQAFPESLLNSDRAFIILNGVVGFYSTRDTNSRQMTHLAFRDSTAGLAAPFKNHSLSAMTTTTIQTFPAADYIALQANQPQMAVKIMTSLLKELSECQHHNYMVGRLNSVAAVAAFILYMHGKQIHLDQPDRDANDVTLILNRYETADYLGLTFETVSRAFSTLKKRGIITSPNSKSVKILHINALRVLF